MFAPNVLVSHLPGQDSATGDGGATDLSISDDGQRVTFLSPATNLVDGQIDQPFSSDLFLFEQGADSLTLVSQSVFSRQCSHVAALEGVNAVPDLDAPRFLAIGFEFGAVQTGKQFARKCGPHVRGKTKGLIDDSLCVHRD